MCDESPTNDRYINLGLVEGVPHIELFKEVSDVIVEENLSLVNEKSNRVKVRESFYTKYGKRILDVLISGLALIVTLPINLILAICTYFDVGSPVLFRQNRVGKNGQIFTMVKFRNMTNECNEYGQLLPASQRVTKFGKFVRRTSLDEVLNFWSIFKGDMSIIGPRPLPVDYYPYFSERHKSRTAVRPGLECPMFHPIEGKLTWYDQFENDIYYVENVSLALDIRMLMMLIRMVFDKKSSTMRGGAMRGSFIGYTIDCRSINSQEVEVKYYNKALQRMGYVDVAHTLGK